MKLAHAVINGSGTTIHPPTMMCVMIRRIDGRRHSTLARKRADEANRPASTKQQQRVTNAFACSD